MQSVSESHDDGSVIKIDEAQLRGHVDEVVRSSVEETFSAMLDAEADQLAGAKRYERSPDRLGPS